MNEFDYTKIQYKIDISPIQSITNNQLSDNQILEIIDYIIEAYEKQKSEVKE